jgi:hypothetical protein
VFPRKVPRKEIAIIGGQKISVQNYKYLVDVGISFKVGVWYW